MSRLVVALTALLAIFMVLDVRPAAADVGNVWEIPDAGGWIFRTARLFAEGDTVSFRTVPKTRGTCVTTHLWAVRTGRWIGRRSECTGFPPRTVLYPVRSGEAGYFMLIAHATFTDTPGLVDVEFADRTVATDFPIGGYRQDLGASGVAGAVIQTVRTPTGVADPYLLLLAGGKLHSFDDDSGVGRDAAIGIVSPAPAPPLVVIVGTVQRTAASGPTRLVANDWMIDRDSDFDRLGDSLETVLRTCPGPSSSPAGWDCTTIGDPQDTDEDGILDYDEVFGTMELTAGNPDGAVLLPFYGGDPRHKDIFIEADWCGRSIVGGATSCPTPTTFDGLPRMTRLSGADVDELVTNYLNMSRVSLPDPSDVDPGSRAGVAIHVDSGGLTGGGTRYADWGGSNCVPRTAGGDPNGLCLYSEGRRDNMNPNRRSSFHYALIAPIGGGQGGQPGLSFVSDVWGDTVAHELGHNVAISHGGPVDGPPGTDIKIDPLDALNCKPHYLGGMNYIYGAGDPVDGTYFFSRGRLAGVVLDKEELDEVFGLGPDDTPGWPTFRNVPLQTTFGYTRDAATDMMVDWNFDGNFWPSVAAPLNFHWNSCATFHRGAGYMAWDLNRNAVSMNIDSTPAIAGLAGYPLLGDVYYFFFVKDGRLYYRRQVRRAPMPHTWSENSQAYRGWDEWNWSDGREIAGLVGGGVTQLDAEAHTTASGERLVVVVYRAPTGELAWLTVAPSTDGVSDVVVHRGSLPGSAAGGAAIAQASGVEMERFLGEIWLAYLRFGVARQQRLDGHLVWTNSQIVEDEAGDLLWRSSLGIGLAARPGVELLMLSGMPNAADARAADLEIRRLDTLDPELDRWELLPGRIPAPLTITTTTEPVIAFRPESRSSHAYGGWYMIVYRNPPGPGNPLTDPDTDVRITDGTGTVVANAVAKLKDTWTNLPEDPHIGVVLARSLSDGEGLMGAFEWSNGRVDFLPYADGVSPTLARDHDDPAGIRYGLCYALRRMRNPSNPTDPNDTVPRPECNPPESRAKSWDPVPPTTVNCTGL